MAWEKLIRVVVERMRSQGVEKRVTVSAAGLASRRWQAQHNREILLYSESNVRKWKSERESEKVREIGQWFISITSEAGRRMKTERERKTISPPIFFSVK